MSLFKTVLLAVFTLNSLFIFGQDNTDKKIKEVFVAFNDFSPFNVSVTYKRQVKNMTFFKIGLVNLSAHGSSTTPVSTSYFPTSTYNFVAGLECGIEFRNSLTEKLSIFHGPNLRFVHETSIFKVDNPAIAERQRKNIAQRSTVGIPYTMGLLYNLNERILFSAEINPGLFFAYDTVKHGLSDQDDRNRYSMDFMLSNKFGLLSIAFRI